VRELDVAANRNATCFVRPLVRSLHDSRAAPGDHRHTSVGELAPHFDGGLVVGVARTQARGAKHRDGLANTRKRIEALDELSEDAQCAPRIGVDECGIAIREEISVCDVETVLRGPDGVDTAPSVISHRRFLSGLAAVWAPRL